MENEIPWRTTCTQSNLSWHWSRLPLAIHTVKDSVGTTDKWSKLATFSLTKLWVDPLSINTTTSWCTIRAVTLMVPAVDPPINAWREIASSFYSSAISIPWVVSETSSLEASWSCEVSSNNSNWGRMHLYPVVNTSLQLKHSPVLISFAFCPMTTAWWA